MGVALENFPGEVVNLQRMCCMAAANIAASADTLAQAVGSSPGLLRAIIAASLRHPRDIALVKAMCIAVNKIFYSDKIKDFVASSVPHHEICDALVVALRSTTNDVRGEAALALRNALTAFSDSASDEALGEGQLFPTAAKELVAALLRSDMAANNAFFCEHVCVAIYCISDSTALQLLILKEGGLVGVARVLKAHADIERAVAEAVDTLSCLVSSGVDDDEQQPEAGSRTDGAALDIDAAVVKSAGGEAGIRDLVSLVHAAQVKFAGNAEIQDSGS